MGQMRKASLIRQCRRSPNRRLIAGGFRVSDSNGNRKAKGLAQAVHSAFQLAECAVGVVIKNAPNLFHEEIRGEGLL